MDYFKFGFILLLVVFVIITFKLMLISYYIIAWGIKLITLAIIVSIIIFYINKYKK